MRYSSDDILQIGKRYNNKKRTYVLVNPLQAKHIPVSPTCAEEMMRTLGTQVAEKYPETKLVIGFAETATAIGAEIARCLSDQCMYVQTTRETFPQGEQWIDFLEEHSHAVEQKLCGDTFSQWLSKTDTVVFVDDEITTGKTLINMVEGLAERYPQLKEKKLVAVSIFNRVSEENEKKMTDAGMECTYLIKLPQDDYAKLVEEITVQEADAAAEADVSFAQDTLCCGKLPDPRCGVAIAAYRRSCEAMADAFVEKMLPAQKHNSRVLVLGTEECMYPALVLGEKLEADARAFKVLCHATTRSPIGVCSKKDYPIQDGVKLTSFYEKERTTYLYNLNQYDAVIVVSDTPREDLSVMRQLAAVLNARENTKFFYLQGGNNVWYL